MDRHRRHLALRRLRLQPRGHPHRPGQVAQPQRGEGLGPARVPQPRRRRSSSARATSRSRCAGCASSRARARPRSSTSTPPSTRPRATPATSTSTCGPSATTRSRCCCSSTSAARWTTTSSSREELFSRGEDRVQAPRVLLLPQLPVRLRVEGQPPPPRRAHAHRRPAAQVRARLQADLRRRRDHEPVRDPAAGRLDRVLQRGGRRGVDARACSTSTRRRSGSTPSPSSSGPTGSRSRSLREIMGGRMYPTTLEGLERAMRYLSK